MRLKGFTLAEVLIALVIIGVVAATTVPTIIANSQEQALKSALKKNYSVLQQATQKYYTDNGISLYSDTLDLNSDDRVEYIKEHFILKYFNIAKDCSISDCSFGEEINWKQYSGKTANFVFRLKPNEYQNSVILNDGSWINFQLGGNRIVVDVNGPHKKPNTVGKDTFRFALTSINSGYEPYDNPSGCTPDSSGWGCTAKVLSKH